MTQRPLICHVVYRFDVGGLENGVVNLINRMTAYDHAVVALTEVTDFAQRIERPDVRFYSLHKPEGHGVAIFKKLYDVFRELKPAIVHTRNLAAQEALVSAALAGVSCRVHGEHGWDVHDLNGGRVSHRVQRKLLRPLVSQYVALSRETEQFLIERIGVPASRVQPIYNGVDTERFAPRQTPRGGPLVIGTVGRLQAVKDQATLLRAVARLADARPDLRQAVRLSIVGDGPLMTSLKELAGQLGISDMTQFAGQRNDVATALQSMDIFVLPSLIEGISNTILEAMSCGLPVVATAVGGNPELVDDGVTGTLVPASDAGALAQALSAYIDQPERIAEDGLAGRNRVLARFSLSSMVSQYSQLYEGVIAQVTGQAVRPVMAPPTAG